MPFTDKVDAKDFAKMDPEYQDLLVRVLTIQADCEIGGPNIYVPEGWVGHRAPTAEDLWKMGKTATGWVATSSRSSRAVATSRSRSACPTSSARRLGTSTTAR